MSSLALSNLARLTLAMSLAVLFVGLVRMPLRRVVGARAAYWVWLAVPISATALWLPYSAMPRAGGLPVVPGLLARLWSDLLATLSLANQPAGLAAGAILWWAAGAVAMLALSVHRQRVFVRSLGRLAQHPDGTWRSAAAQEPMLVGALPPRIVLPLDFDLRYSPEERDLVLAHELAHVRRGDPLANALSAACLCAFWFNPLMYWAASSLRFDQDLACDASVIVSAGAPARRRYVAALVKTQIPPSSWMTARLACHWRSAHPLTRRIALLNQPLTGRKRHALGILLVSTLAVSASFATDVLLPPGSPSVAQRATGGVHTGKVCPLTLRRLAAQRARSSH